MQRNAKLSLFLWWRSQNLNQIPKNEAGVLEQPVVVGGGRA